MMRRDDVERFLFDSFGNCSPRHTSGHAALWDGMESLLLDSCPALT